MAPKHHPLRDPIRRSATEYGPRLEIALTRAREVPDEMLARAPVDALVDAIVDECAAAPVTVDHAGLWIETSELSHGREEPLVQLNLCVTVDGASSALGSRGVLSGAHIEGDKPGKWFLTAAQATNEEVADAMADTERLGKFIEEFQGRLREAAAAANEEIQQHRADMRAQVMAVVGARARRVRAVLAATDALGIPVAPRSAEQRIPLQPRIVTLAQLDTAVAAGREEWHLAEQIAEDITGTIMSFTAALERLVRSASKLVGEDEETIRDFLLFILNANYQGAVTGETFLGRGKTDILLRWRDRDAFIGECKFWHGPAKFAGCCSTALSDRDASPRTPPASTSRDQACPSTSRARANPTAMPAKPEITARAVICSIAWSTAAASCCARSTPAAVPATPRHQLDGNRQTRRSLSEALGWHDVSVHPAHRTCCRAESPSCWSPKGRGGASPRAAGQNGPRLSSSCAGSRRRGSGPARPRSCGSSWSTRRMNG
ncbi:hypothetical protein [Micromonospora sp. WMMD1219]|uniref:hypothetical protein n=1 Tax=Micromonospora sp. WMMD1219 TaxID=3404115 RepID=UPI003BF4E8CD